MRVRQRGDGPRLACELLNRFRLGFAADPDTGLPINDLDGDLTIEFRLLSEIDLTHAPATDAPQDTTVSQLHAFETRQLLHSFSATDRPKTNRYLTDSHLTLFHIARAWRLNHKLPGLDDIQRDACDAKIHHVRLNHIRMCIVYQRDAQNGDRMDGSRWINQLRPPTHELALQEAHVEFKRIGSSRRLCAANHLGGETVGWLCLWHVCFAHTTLERAHE